MGPVIDTGVESFEHQARISVAFGFNGARDRHGSRAGAFDTPTPLTRSLQWGP